MFCHALMLLQELLKNRWENTGLPKIMQRNARIAASLFVLRLDAIFVQTVDIQSVGEMEHPRGILMLHG
jgi:hypothetical protein